MWLASVVELQNSRGGRPSDYMQMHTNEVAILPYYIANLNIEFTFKQKMGHYKQFPNLCFVDTLDNTAGLGAGVQHDIFGISRENATRIRRQNERKISVNRTQVWACPSQKPRVALSARTPRSFVGAGYPLQSLT